jgi:signal transduction histidine kinase
MGTFGDIRRRIILLFVLGIGLPSSLLGYLALRGIRNDQALLERERRDELLEVAAGAVAAHDSGLVVVGRALDSALVQADSQDLNTTPALEELASHNPLIEAVFRLNAEGGIDEFVVPGLLFHASDQTPETVEEPLTAVESVALEAARRFEFREGDLGRAISAYQTLMSGTSNPRIQAEALAGIARVQRERGDLDAASNSYRRLKSEFGEVSTAGGIPFSIAAGLELGRTLELAGDADGAGRTLVDLYADLVRAEGGLSRAQFGFIGTSIQESLSELFSDSVRGGQMAALADTLRNLQREEGLARAHTERLLAFRASGGGALLARGIGEPEAPADGYRRALINVDRYVFYALVGALVSETSDGMARSWGVLLAPETLESRLVGALQDRTGPEGIPWSLRGGSGEILAASGEDAIAPAPPINGPAAVSAALPGGVPPFTIELYPPDEGFVRTLLTSRRGVFFYAFLLLAGILVFGLILTVMTVSHQLALARLQSDFVSTVSHEFKSPLTAVRQAAEALQTGRVPSEEKRQKYYDLLLEQSERLSLLINRVLDFARMDSGQHTFDRKPVDLGHFLEGQVAEGQQRFGHQGFVVRCEIDSPLSAVAVDAGALAQALTNLIDNAIKYSGDSREVVVRGSTEDGMAVIAVQDFGVGLDPKEGARVFERFYRGGDELTRSARGTGLGLTLVKQIVEGHGGSIVVESELGHGSTFTIRLPLGEIRT